MLSEYYSLLRRVSRLEALSRKMCYEGGAAGHMKHIYDYTDLTLLDVKDIITRLFSGDVEDVTEKLDGMNIQCSMNRNGQVVFVRNKKDLNSDIGGMLQDDISSKWAGRENVAKTYLSAYDTITKVFSRVGVDFFNPDSNTKILANCECISAGKTNILVYTSAQVDFHNLWVYTRKDENSSWEKSDVITSGKLLNTLERACENITGAQLTPRLVIRVTEKSNALCDSLLAQADELFAKAGCGDGDTIDDYKRFCFYKLCKKKYKWIAKNDAGMGTLFDRWFNDDKSFKLNELKKIYKDNLEDLLNIDYKQVVFEATRALDVFFGKLGNAVISVCEGMVNAGSESSVITELSNDLKNIVEKVKAEGSAEMNVKLTNQLNRLAELGDQINASEGIVFRVGDRLMKCTGSFASLNQILGMRYRL